MKELLKDLKTLTKSPPSFTDVQIKIDSSIANAEAEPDESAADAAFDVQEISETSDEDKQILGASPPTSPCGS